MHLLIALFTRGNESTRNDIKQRIDMVIPAASAAKLVARQYEFICAADESVVHFLRHDNRS